MNIFKTSKPKNLTTPPLPTGTQKELSLSPQPKARLQIGDDRDISAGWIIRLEAKRSETYNKYFPPVKKSFPRAQTS